MKTKQTEMFKVNRIEGNKVNRTIATQGLCWASRKSPIALCYLRHPLRVYTSAKQVPKSFKVSCTSGPPCGAQKDLCHSCCLPVPERVNDTMSWGRRKRRWVWDVVSLLENKCVLSEISARAAEKRKEIN